MNERKRGWFRDQSGQAVLLGAFATITLAISMMAGFRYIGPKYSLTHATSTAFSSNNVSSAITAYTNANAGNLPCPDLDGSGYAADDPSGGHNTATTATLCSPANPATTQAVWGMVPWRTLHLSQQAAIDQYGHQITYAVGTTSAPNPGLGSIAPGSGGPVYHGAASVSYYGCQATGLLTSPATETVTTTTGPINYTKLTAYAGGTDATYSTCYAPSGTVSFTASDGTTSSVSQTDPYPYILVSHGADGKGSYQPTTFGNTSTSYTSPKQNAIVTSALQAVNCPRSLSSTVCNTNINTNNFVYGPAVPKNTLASGDNTFDDIVTLGNLDGTQCQDTTPEVTSQNFAGTPNSTAGTGTLEVTVHAPKQCSATLTVYLDFINSSTRAYFSTCPVWSTSNNTAVTVTPAAGVTPTGCTSSTLTQSYTAQIPASALATGSVSLDLTFTIAGSKNPVSTCANAATSGCPYFNVIASTANENTTTPTQIANNTAAGSTTTPATPLTLESTYANSAIPQYILYTSPTTPFQTFGNTPEANYPHSRLLNIPMNGTNAYVLTLGDPNSSDTSSALPNNSQTCTWFLVPFNWSSKMFRAYFEASAGGAASQTADGFTFTFLPDLGSSSTSWLNSSVCGGSPVGGTTEGSYLGFENISGSATTAATAAAVLGHISTGTTCVQGAPGNGQTGCLYQINISNIGSGYFSPPTITIGAPAAGGTQATAYTTLTTAGGKITGITVTAKGAGYTSTPTVSISGGGGTGATATATMARTGSRSGSTRTTCSTRRTCYVAAINLTSGGTGFSSTPTVTISGGGGSGATATASPPSALSGVASIVITNQGLKYTSAPTVSIATSSVITPRMALEFDTYESQNVDPPDGLPNQSVRHDPATEHVALDVVDTSGPHVVITGTGGSGAYAVPIIGSYSGSTCTATAPTTSTVGCIYSIVLTAGGSGFGSAPTVTILGGGGSGAVATATVAGTAISAITITNHGAGYLSQHDDSFHYSTSGTAFPTSGSAATGTYQNTQWTTVSAASGAAGATCDTTTSGTGSGACTYNATGNTNIVTVKGASATTTVSAGKVTAITVVDPGSGYGAAPLITLSGSVGSGATATATLGKISSTTGSCVSGTFSGTEPGCVLSIAVGAQGTGYTIAPSVAMSPSGVVYSQGSPVGKVYYHPVRIEAARYCNSTCSSCGNTSTAADHYMLVRTYMDCPATFGNGTACSDVTSPVLMTSTGAPGTFAAGTSIPTTASTTNYCMADPGYQTQIGISAYDTMIFGITAGSGAVNNGFMFTNAGFGSFSP